MSGFFCVIGRFADKAKMRREECVLCGEEDNCFTILRLFVLVNQCKTKYNRMNNQYFVEKKGEYESVFMGK